MSRLLYHGAAELARNGKNGSELFFPLQREGAVERNERIRAQYAAGQGVKALAEQYHLSESSVYKIVRRRESRGRDV